MSFKIITDSSCNLTEETIDELGLHILTLAYFVNDVEHLSYIPGQKFDFDAFYGKLKEKASVRTSQVTPPQAREAIQPLLEEGHDVLYVGFSSGLSGTFSAVALTLEELKDEFPDRKILYVDTLAASAGQGMLVLETARQRDAGKPVEEVHAWLEANKLNVCHYFTVDDLWHLHRGGRLSAGKALMGTMLSVKPILCVNEIGKLVPVGKAKGRKKSLDFIVDKMAEGIDTSLCDTVYAIYSSDVADAEYLTEQAKARVPGIKSGHVRLEPVIGCHGGPGICALIYMGKNR